MGGVGEEGGKDTTTQSPFLMTSRQSEHGRGAISEDEPKDSSGAAFLDTSTIRRLCSLMAVGGFMALVVMFSRENMWMLPLLYYALSATKTCIKMRDAWKQTSSEWVLNRMPYDCSPLLDFNGDVYRPMFRELKEHRLCMEAFFNARKSRKAPVDDILKIVNRKKGNRQWAHLQKKDIFFATNPSDKAIVMGCTLHGWPKPDQPYYTPIAEQPAVKPSGIHFAVSATHVMWDHYVGEEVCFGFGCENNPLPRDLYGTSARAMSERGEDMHSKVRRLKTHVTTLMRNYPSHRHVVYLYGRFSGGRGAVLSALALSTIADLDIVLYTEGCLPVLSIEAVNVLWDRMRPSLQAGILQATMEGGSGVLVREPLNSIRCFNCFADKDCVPFMDFGDMVFHHAPYFLGCSATNDETVGTFFRNFAPFPCSGPMETLGRLVILVGVWLQGIHLFRYTWMWPYRLDLYTDAFQRQRDSACVDERDVMCLLECFTLTNKDYMRAPPPRIRPSK